MAQEVEDQIQADLGAEVEEVVPWQEAGLEVEEVVEESQFLIVLE